MDAYVHYLGPNIYYYRITRTSEHFCQWTLVESEGIRDAAH